MMTLRLQDDNNENDQKAMLAALKEDDMGDDMDQKDDGYIELVLRVLARMCDGQHKGLQDYLREQPDNMKSFNIVAETAQFVNLVYSNITTQNIQLVVQLFSTLNEFAVVSHVLPLHAQRVRCRKSRASAARSTSSPS